MKTFYLLPLLALAACGAPTSNQDSDCAQASQGDCSQAIESDCAQPARGDCEFPIATREWPHRNSDIQVDDRINFGSFDNGLRFAWANNPEPNDRVYLRLHVNVGSLAEEESEQGMAHFLEHMAFNGSTNFPAGTLIEWFQDHGMSFGADTNAHTAFSETVYKLDLPNSDSKTLREGLTVMQDFAFNLLIEEAEVQAEKGVIDGEQRERDSDGWRVMLKQLEEMFQGIRHRERLPIGLKEIRDEFTAKSVRAFYEKWYRPDNMTLVLVGDLGELNPEELFAEYFGAIPAAIGPCPQEPEVGSPETLAFLYGIYEDEIPTVDIALDRLSIYQEEELSVEEWLNDLPLNYAYGILNLRFSELAKKESTPFLSASASESNVFNVFEGQSLSVSADPEKWQEAFAVAEQELRKALKFGFQDAELDELRANAMRGLDEAVKREATSHSRGLLSGILKAAEEEFVPTRAAWRREQMAPALEALSVDQCIAALRDAWSKGEDSLYTTGNLDLGSMASVKLNSTLSASRKVAVKANDEISIAEFAYASTAAKKGKIVEEQMIDDLDFQQISFANGVTVNLKKTEFKENQVLISANLGEGRISLANEQQALAFVAGQVFDGGGLAAHSADDLRRINAGKQVGVGFGMGDDRFSFSGSTTMEDLLRQCELMCAYLTAPGWRDDSLIQLRRAVPQMFEGLKHQHGGPLSTDFIPGLYENDPRVGLPAMKDILNVEMTDVAAWFNPQFSDGPLELSVVGDIDIDEAISAIAQTFGTLPTRRGAKSFDERRSMPLALQGSRMEYTIETQVPKSLVFIVYPMTDGIDTANRRSMSMLEAVLSDRLRLEVRERLGAAYSPGAGSEFSMVYPGDGIIYIQAMSDPDKVETLVEACLATADALAKDGASNEEVERLREPIVNQLRDSRRTNSFWLGAIAESHWRPASLNDVRSVKEFYSTVSAEQISPLAAKYFSRANANICVVNPATEEE